jgi:salicylate hydroxylase
VDAASGLRHEIRDIDLVVSADGRYSALRAQRCGEPVPRHLGVSNFRDLVDDGGRIDVDDMEQWYNGPHRLIAFRMLDGLIYVSGNLPIEPSAQIPEHYKDPAFLRTAFLDGFARPDPRLDALSAIFARQAPSLHWARAQEIEPLYHDPQCKVMFVGDASHAMCPTLGQGATQAIEDGATLVALLRQAVLVDALKPEVICRAFARLRSARVDFVRRFSWDASDTLLIGSDPIVSNRAKAHPDFLGKLRHLYNDLRMNSTDMRAALALRELV